jgi:hypothetical protein
MLSLMKTIDKNNQFRNILWLVEHKDDTKNVLNDNGPSREGKINPLGDEEASGNKLSSDESP